jgi:threonyl-tRNA synthetase
MLLVGEKEAAEGKVAVRKHGQGDQGVMDLKEFVAQFSANFALPADASYLNYTET